MHSTHSFRSLILREAGLSEVCARTRPSSSIRIALIDGAVNLTHPAFTGCRIIKYGNRSAHPAAAHATFGASVLVANDMARSSGRTLGLCPDSTVVNIAVVSDEMLDGSASVRETAATLSAAVDSAVRAGCQIIVFGISVASTGDPAWAPLRHSLRAAAAADTLPIFPAGNHPHLSADGRMIWPEVLTVGSCDWKGYASPFSGTLSYAQNRIFAPGEHLPGAIAAADYTFWSGSSGATVVAAGAIALGCSISSGSSPFEVASRLCPLPSRVLNGANSSDEVLPYA